MAMPEIDIDYHYLIEWIYDVGFCMAGGMSAVSIPFSELYAWSELTQNEPSPFDIKCLRNMSIAYVSMQEKAKKSDTIDPTRALLNGK